MPQRTGSRDIILIAVVNNRIWNVLTNGPVCAGIGPRHLIVFTIMSQRFCPVDDRIAGIGIGIPLRVDRCIFRQRITECVGLRVRQIAVSMRILIRNSNSFREIIPSAKGISEPLHLRIRTRSLGHSVSQNKLRSIVLTAFPVLIKHKPVTFRSTDVEFHVIFDCYTRVIRIIIYCFTVNG